MASSVRAVAGYNGSMSSAPNQRGVCVVLVASDFLGLRVRGPLENSAAS